MEDINDVDWSKKALHSETNFYIMEWLIEQYPIVEKLNRSIKLNKNSSAVWYNFKRYHKIK